MTSSSPLIFNTFSSSKQEQDELMLSFINTDFITESDPAGGAPNLPQQSFISSTNFFDFGLDAPSPPWSESVSSDSGTGLTTSPELGSSLSDGESGSNENGSNDCEGNGMSMEGMESESDGYFQYVTPNLMVPPSTVGMEIPFDLTTNYPNFQLPTEFHFDPTAILQTQQPFYNYPQSPITPSDNFSSSKSNSDSSEPKRKRGRKKRDAPPTLTSSHPVPLKPLMPILPSSAQPVLQQHSSELKLVKMELPPSPPAVSPKLDSEPLKKKPALAPAPSAALLTSSIQIKPEPQTSGLVAIAQKQTPIMPSPPAAQTPADPIITAHQKRQERLIKNRAAALLSRKRKREHITLLEQHTEQLERQNIELTDRVNGLELECGSLKEECVRLGKENEELKKRLDESIHRNTPIVMPTAATSMTSVAAAAVKGSTRTTGVVFMIILFSFALFTIPSSNTSRLTTGGSPRSSPIASFHGVSKNPPSKTFTVKSLSPVAKPTADLVAVSDVKTKDLAHFLEHPYASLYPSSSSAAQENGLVQAGGPIRTPLFTTPEEALNHAYLYCANLKQLVPREWLETGKDPRDAIVLPEKPTMHTSTGLKRPRLSLFSPRNETALPFAGDDDVNKEYLQIDVEVVSSRFVSSSIVSPTHNEPVAVKSPLAMEDVHIKEEGDDEWEVGMKRLRMTVTTGGEENRRMKRRKEKRARRGGALVRI